MRGGCSSGAERMGDEAETATRRVSSRIDWGAKTGVSQEAKEDGSL